MGRLIYHHEYVGFERDYPFVGRLHLYSDEQALLAVYFESSHALATRRWARTKVQRAPLATPIMLMAIQQISEYLAGVRRDFALPLAIEGSDFQRTVWQALCTISFGTTVSYQSLAQAISRPLSVRAVAQAIARNHFLMIIPCHRVIATGGGLGGYSGGLAKKQWLLTHEASIPI